MKPSPYYNSEPLFRNTKQETLTFSEMFSRILSFIKEDPKSSYRIAIGTDSMVKTSSCLSLPYCIVSAKVRLAFKEGNYPSPHSLFA